jgi:leader peptidase (prepilin peptidase)/N-methyltransferase
MTFDLMVPWVWAVGGLLVGSLLNVLIHRWPLMLAQETPSEQRLNLVFPRSHCPHCHTPLTIPQLIPVLSFLWLRGRCGHCQHPIAWRYPLVELLNMAWWLWCGLALPNALTPMPLTGFPGLTAGLPGALTWGPSLAWSLWGSAVLALAWIDWDSTWLPDGLTQPLVWGGLVAAAWGWSGVPLPQALAGAVLGYLSLWSVATVFQLATGHEGMGDGDFKLLAALGAWCGPLLLIPLVLVASVLGLLVGVVLRARGQLREGRYIPFGPFLVGAAVALRLGLDRLILTVWGVS